MLIILCTWPSTSWLVAPCPSSSLLCKWLPRINLRLDSAIGLVPRLHINRRILPSVHSRVVRLVSAPRRGVVGDVVRLRPAAVGLGQRFEGRRRVNGVRDPCVPQGLDLRAVMCAVHQPASSRPHLGVSGPSSGRTGHSRAPCSPPIVFAL